MNFDEFYDFMVENKNKMKKRDKSAEELQRIHKKEKKECLLTEDQFTIMREIFDKIDVHKDLVVPRTKLVDAMKRDIRMKKYLDRGVVYVPLVKREIPLRKVLH